MREGGGFPSMASFGRASIIYICDFCDSFIVTAKSLLEGRLALVRVRAFRVYLLNELFEGRLTHLFCLSLGGTFGPVFLHLFGLS